MGGGGPFRLWGFRLFGEDAFNFPRWAFFSLRRHPLSRSSSPSRNTKRWINPCIPAMLPVDTLATMGKSYGRDALPKTVALVKQQATLQNFFRPKAPPIFRTPEPVAPAAAALVDPEPEVDPAIILTCLQSYLHALHAAPPPAQWRHSGKDRTQWSRYSEPVVHCPCDCPARMQALPVEEPPPASSPHTFAWLLAVRGLKGWLKKGVLIRAVSGGGEPFH